MSSTQERGNKNGNTNIFVTDPNKLYNLGWKHKVELQKGIKKFMNGIKINNELPKITIVTVTFNAERYLEKTILSVKEQDYRNIEYIIIDGESTDNTVSVIKKYEKYISSWISEPDVGIYDAMNKAIDKATGDWINFMNAGDSFTNSKILSQFIKKVEPNKTIVCGAINVVNDDNEILFNYTPKISTNLLEKCFCNHQATFVKTKLLKKNPFNLHYKYAADYDFLINIGKKYNNFQILNFTVTDYLNNGLWEQNKTKALIECLNIIANNLDNQTEIYTNILYKTLNSFNPQRKLDFSNDLNKMKTIILEIQKKYKNILIYGNGTVTEFILPFLNETKITAICDQNISTKKIKEIPIIQPEAINDYNFDVILITVLGREEKIIYDLNTKFDINIDKFIKFFE